MMARRPRRCGACDSYPGFSRAQWARAHWRGSLRDSWARHGGLVLRRSPPACPRVFRTRARPGYCGSHALAIRNQLSTRLAPYPTFARPALPRLSSWLAPENDPPRIRPRPSIEPCRITDVTCPPHAQAVPGRPVSPHRHLTAVVNSEAPSQRKKSAGLLLHLKNRSGRLLGIPRSFTRYQESPTRPVPAIQNAPR